MTDRRWTVETSCSLLPFSPHSVGSSVIRSPIASYPVSPPLPFLRLSRGPFGRGETGSATRWVRRVSEPWDTRNSPVPPFVSHRLVSCVARYVGSSVPRFSTFTSLPSPLRSEALRARREGEGRRKRCGEDYREPSNWRPRNQPVRSPPIPFLSPFRLVLSLTIRSIHEPKAREWEWRWMT